MFWLDSRHSAHTECFRNYASTIACGSPGGDCRNPMCRFSESYVGPAASAAELDSRERALAAEHMRDGGIERASVYRGSPEGNEPPEGRDFGADGQFRYDGQVGS